MGAIDKAATAAEEFVRKWGPNGSAYKLNERSGAQQHFLNLCRLLDVPEPTDASNYCFERSIGARAGDRGFADVWKRGCFAWEYKAPGGDLNAALRQLMRYALPLENPPLLVVSDRQRIEIHTHFTGYPSERTSIPLDGLRDAVQRRALRNVFLDPDQFKPTKSSAQITAEAATEFAAMAKRMVDRGVQAGSAAHFLTQCLFCFFAQGVDLLPVGLISRVLERGTPETVRRKLVELFQTMKSGGAFGADDIRWFNGGLFNVIEVPPIDDVDLAALRRASAHDWSSLDAAVLGTLFERGLDPAKRRQLGAHYTDAATIAKVIAPVIDAPLREAWSAERNRIAGILQSSKRKGDVSFRRARQAHLGFLERLRAFVALDPACGSGNFLYASLRALKDIEHAVNSDAHAMGLDRELDLVTGPHNVAGIEMSPHAAELSRVTVWIGELQWRLAHGYSFKDNPVLDPLDQIECRDAVLSEAGARASWPRADAIVGNPPFIGDKKMRAELGDRYTDLARQAYRDLVPGGADFVCFWFQQASDLLRKNGAGRAGLVATSSVRGGRSRQVISGLSRSTPLFEAWSDIEWVNEGAAVRVSIICFSADAVPTKRLDGAIVHEIYPDPTFSVDDHRSCDLTAAKPLSENEATCFVGTSKKASFDVAGSTARSWIVQTNADGRSNGDVVKPWTNGKDILAAPSRRWIIDFGTSMSVSEAALYQLPFAYCEKVVRAEKVHCRAASERGRWWLHARTAPEMRSAIAGLRRYLCSSVVAKHRVWVWLDRKVLPSHANVVVAREDDLMMGLLQCRFHSLWATRQGTSLEDRPRYTPRTSFDTFPFPHGMRPAEAEKGQAEDAEGVRIPRGLSGELRARAVDIAKAAKKLNELRVGWLYPKAWTVSSIDAALDQGCLALHGEVEPEPQYVPTLKLRTLTALYNEHPAWLRNCNEELDYAVALAYGWTDYESRMTDEELLRRLLALNVERARCEAHGQRELPMLGVVQESVPTTLRHMRRSVRSA